MALAGRSFSAEEVLATPYVNTAFYRFDAQALSMALHDLRADNAQGEIYLTDVIERFAAERSLSTYVIDAPSDMLTYSTRPELRRIAHMFLRSASAFLKDISSFNSQPSTNNHQLSTLLTAFISRYGDRPCVIASAPGRVNLMGRHIEHRGGSVNMMAIGARTTFVVAPREDDVVNIANLDPAFPSAAFSISSLLNSQPSTNNRQLSTSPAATAAWLDFLDSAPIKADLEASRGHWMNYVKSAVLRFQMASQMPLCGMDIMAVAIFRWRQDFPLPRPLLWRRPRRLWRSMR